MSYTKHHTEDECDRCLKNVGKASLIPVPFLYLDRNDRIHPNKGKDYHQYYVCKKCYKKELKTTVPIAEGRGKSREKSNAQIILAFLKLNPKHKRKDLSWRSDGRLEWICKHGVGHTVYSPDDFMVHGCDDCCKGTKIVKNKESGGRSE